MIKQALSKLLYAVFPRRCSMCGDVVELDSDMCFPCKTQHYIKEEICLNCGCELAQCHCRKNAKKPEYKAVVAPYYYEDNVIKAVHRLKFYGFIELSPAMAHKMSVTISERYKDIFFDYIVFVPLSAKRYKKRGYNQTMLLANDISKELNIPVLDALSKVFDTKTQRGAKLNERKINLHGSFDIKVSPDAVKNKNILLIDDVKTTGSTLNECAMVLKGYGAANVYACTFSVTKRGK